MIVTVFFQTCVPEEIDLIVSDYLSNLDNFYQYLVV